MNNPEVVKVTFEELFPIDDSHLNDQERSELFKKCFSISPEEEAQINRAYNTPTNSKLDLSRVSFEGIGEVKESDI